MLLQGAVLIAGAAETILPTALLPFDELMGTQSSAAAAALGVGLCVAAANPAANVSWVRIGILYAALVIGYQAFAYLVLGKHASVEAVAFSVACAGLMAILYPHRDDLMPKTPRRSHATAVAPGTGPELTSN